MSERAWGGDITPAPVVLKRPSPSEGLIMRALIADIYAGLLVLNDSARLSARGGFVIPEAQLLDRARNIVGGLAGNFRIEMLPAEEDTVTMASIGSKGG